MLSLNSHFPPALSSLFFLIKPSLSMKQVEIFNSKPFPKLPLEVFLEMSLWDSPFHQSLPDVILDELAELCWWRGVTEGRGRTPGALCSLFWSCWVIHMQAGKS